MTKTEAQKRITFLITELDRHNHLYHSLDQPEISDFKFDQLFKELLSLEELYPELKSKNSPTQKVGGTVIDAFKKTAHKEPMLSLQNTYSEEEILDFEKKIHRQLSTDQSLEFFCSPKFDGVAIELVYEKGQLTHAITRGDGSVGEDVISNVKTIGQVPLKLSGKNYPDRIDIRGEILIFKKDFAELNETYQERGLLTFANPRNAAAGTLRQLDSSVAAERNLKLFCYSLGYCSEDFFKSQADFEAQISQWGLPIMPVSQLNQLSPQKLSCLCVGAQEVIEYYHRVEKERLNLDFDIDGIVVKINSYKTQKSLGNIARSPRWAFAAKFKPQQAQTLIEKIIVQVGRTGALTPVAVMTPVEVGGVTITHATLHNQDEIDRKDVRVGDTVVIHRAGDVIPEVLEVNLAKRPKNSKPYQIPKVCPSCQSETEQLEGEVIRRCVNSLCPSVMVESLKHFVSRNAMNIDKLGARQIEIFFEKNLVTTFSDIYKLNFDKVIALDRQGEKSTQNLIDSIEKSKQTDLHRFIYALGIRFVGEQTARTLAQHYKSMEAFLSTTEEELLNLPDVGPKVAQSILKVLSQKIFIKEVHKLLELGVTPKKIKETSSAIKGLFAGMGFVVTGTLPVPRNQAHDMIREAGGQILSSVSKNTSVLVAGENAGSKLDKAEKLNLVIWSWDDLLKKLQK